MNVLSIGNSFSQDAQTYLHAISRAEHDPIFCVNLYIGGCSLEQHFRNIMGDKREYEIQVCGKRSGFYTSIQEALLSRQWNVVTLQQVSHESADFKNYTPFLEEIASYVRKLSPTAKVYLHETWGYEDGSARLANQGFDTMEDMSEKIFASYEKARAVIQADGIIPSGHGMLALKRAADVSVHRDTFHAGLGGPRYLLGCIWYETLTGKSVACDTFSDFDVEVSCEEAALARKIAHDTVNELKKGNTYDE